VYSPLSAPRASGFALLHHVCMHMHPINSPMAEYKIRGAGDGPLLSFTSGFPLWSGCWILDSARPTSEFFSVSLFTYRRFIPCLGICQVISRNLLRDNNGGIVDVELEKGSANIVQYIPWLLPALFVTPPFDSERQNIHPLDDRLAFCKTVDAQHPPCYPTRNPSFPSDLILASINHDGLIIIQRSRCRSTANTHQEPIPARRGLHLQRVTVQDHRVDAARGGAVCQCFLRYW